MIRYLKINYILFKNSYIRDSKIPGYVLSSLVFHLFEILVAIIFFNVLFANTKNLGGWNFYQVLFLYAFSSSIISFHSAWTRKGTRSMAAELVRMGDFDFYITKPVNAMILVSISKPRIYDFVTMFFQMGMALYAVFKGDIPIRAENLAWFIFLTVTGITLYYFLQIIAIIPAFWVIRSYNLQFLIARLSQFMRWPVGVFPGFIKIGLMTIFPIMAVAYIPARTLFYPPNFLYIGYMVLITIFFGILAGALWRYGEKNYSSASS
jgi:ABC-2 type transport system permease protein